MREMRRIPAVRGTMTEPVELTPNRRSLRVEKWDHREADVLGGSARTPIASSRQRVEQRFRLAQVGGVEPLGEAAIDGRQEIATFITPPLASPEFGECRSGSQFPELCLLPLRERDGRFEALFCFIRALLWLGEQHLRLEAKQFRFVPPLARVDAASSADLKRASAPSTSPAAALVRPTIPIRIGRWKRREGNDFKVSRAASACRTPASTSPCSTRTQPCMILAGMR